MIDPSFQFSKKECADAHFEAACGAFLCGDHPSVVVTLAGVAEELYGALISHRDGWSKEDHPRAIDVLVDWASAADGLGVDRDYAWKFIYAAKNSVKHGRDITEIAVVDPATVVYMITMALVNRLSVDPTLDGQAAEVAEKLSDIWAQRPEWVEVKAQKWDRDPAS